MGADAAEHERASERIDGLTDATTQVARAVCRGATNAEIAAARGTSTRTVANQIAAILRRLRVSSRVELALKLTAAQSTGHEEVPGASALTHHEHRICVLVAMGHSDKEISYILGLSTGAVSAALSRARAKLNVRSRVAIARLWRTP